MVDICAECYEATLDLLAHDLSALEREIVEAIACGDFDEHVRKRAKELGFTARSRSR